MPRCDRRRSLALLLLLACLAAGDAPAQTRIMPVGDSITQGGQSHASYRYALWFDLQQASYVVDFVGGLSVVNGVDPPNPVLYPDYLTTFDRDHEARWGWRTDEILDVIDEATAAELPDIVLLQLGTNDIGQQGAAGVTNADTNLRAIIAELRAANPAVVILLAQIPPIGPSSGYFPNAGQIGPLNAAIAQIAADLDSEPSPVVLVDQNTGFDLNTMMQDDDLHPNTTGEAQLASVWQSALTPFLTPGNPPPAVSLTAPASGASFVAPVDLALSADASDPNGSVVQVSFFAGGALLDVDAAAPFETLWLDAPPGSHTITAVAMDDEGAETPSSPVVVTVLPAGAGVPIAVSNPSFEDPVLVDADLWDGPGTIGGWTFSATPATFSGIFNPPVDSYSSAAGNATPIGADGANVAFLFNDGGPAESVEATQLLAETLQPDRIYVLSVAIGHFLPSQPFSPSSYGGYRIELLAGSTLIAWESDGMTPPLEEFRDAVALVSSNELPPSLIGQPLTIRLTISASEADRSTHFDHVRLTRGAPPVPSLGGGGMAVLAALLAGAALLLAPRPRAH